MNVTYIYTPRNKPHLQRYGGLWRCTYPDGRVGWFLADRMPYWVQA